MCKEEYTIDGAFPPGRGDHAIGERITFIENGQQREGEVIHVAAPGQTVSGLHHPLSYLTDCNDGFPHMVFGNQIVEQQ